MDLFKRDPFTAGLAAATALLVLGALYYVYTSHSLLSEQAEGYNSSTATLGQLQSANPFPSEDNLRAVSAEVDDAKRLLALLSDYVSKQSAPLDASLTPQQFQDSLNSKVGELVKLAAGTGTLLPEDFYLGFGEYRTQPPTVAAAPLLGQQLESIANIASLIIKAGAKEMTSISRRPLPVETPAEEATKNDQSPAVAMAPFDIAFVCEQAVFRDAFAAIVNATPLVFVRLLSVANSQPAAPPKSGGETAAPAADEAASGQIPVVFGRETLQVNMRLASVSSTPPTKQP
jgi:hypothetical protein